MRRSRPFPFNDDIILQVFFSLRDSTSLLAFRPACKVTSNVFKQRSNSIRRAVCINIVNGNYLQALSLVLASIRAQENEEEIQTGDIDALNMTNDDHMYALVDKHGINYDFLRHLDRRESWKGTPWL
jgi:hypothetical protein